MATDSASWRYRITDIDYITTVFDFILFATGTDTVANGNTYHKIFSRTFSQVVGHGVIPPIITETANTSDIYYGTMRENSTKRHVLFVEKIPC